MIGPPEPVKLAHSWQCTRPVPRVTRTREVDGRLLIVTTCPRCGASDEEEA